MLDPLTAIGLASSIVQLVDFSSKLLVKGYEIYHATDGASHENLEVEAVTESLHVLTNRIILDPSNNAADPTMEERALKDLAQQGVEIAQALLDILNDLKVQAPGKFRSWESLRQSFRSVRKAGKIEKLQKKLDRITLQLNTHLIRNLGTSYGSTTMAKLQDLELNSRRMHLDNTRDLMAAQQATLHAFEDQKKQMEEFRASTRQSQEKHAAAMAVGFRAIFTQLEDMRREGGAVFTAQKILESLTFPEMTHRHDEIKPAYTDTFKWIFEDHTTAFPRWLRSGSGVFWINGKAGSGKSTLMKFLCRHPGTHDAVHQWAPGEKLVTANYFFWSSGLEKQKSQEGLLQSLLFQMLSRCPELIPAACPRRWAADDPLGLDVRSNPWSREELSQVLANVLVSRDLSAKSCFFIDGLDEYSGDHYALVQDLARLAQTDKIKLCVSSRPWNAFVKAYDGAADQKLVLQYLTRADMEKYVHGMLHEDERFRDLARRDASAQVLVESVRERAEGVFLWVFLVVKSLLAGLTEDDGIPMLQKRLEEIPSDLKEYLKQIINSVDPVYRDHTARTIQLATISIPVSLSVFWHLPLDMVDHGYASALEIRRAPPDEVARITREATSNINKWGRDLLEAHHPSWGVAESRYPHDLRPNPQLNFTVHFLHRTVRDFLQDEMRDFLGSRVVCQPSPYLALCRLHLAVAKSLNIPDGGDEAMQGFVRVADTFMRYARLCEIHDRSAPTRLLLELDRVGTVFRSQGGGGRSHWSNVDTSAFRNRPLVSNFLAYAVQNNLLIFVRSRLDEDPASIRPPGVDPLLLHAFPETLRWHYMGEHGPGLYTLEGEEDTLQSSHAMMQLLLARGATPNDGPPGAMTVWQLWLACCFRTPHEKMWPLAELLARSSAALDDAVPVNKQSNTLTWTAKDASETSRGRGAVRAITDRATVAECLRKCRPDLDVDAFLRSLAPAKPRSSGWSSWFPAWKR